MYGSFSPAADAGIAIFRKPHAVFRFRGLWVRLGTPLIRNKYFRNSVPKRTQNAPDGFVTRQGRPEQSRAHPMVLFSAARLV